MPIPPFPHPATFESLRSLTRTVFRPGANDQPEVVGSCFLTRFGSDVLLVTAEHVLSEGAHSKPLFFDMGEGQKLKRIEGNAFQPLNAKSAIPDPLDICVVVLGKSLSGQVVNDAIIPASNFRTTIECGPQSWYFIFGAPVNMNLQAAQPSLLEVGLSPYGLSCRESTREKYKNLNLDPAVYIALNWDRKRLYSDAGTKRRGPQLHGLSGAPIWLVEGRVATIVGVAIEQHAQARKAVVGVRWQVIADAVGI
jgi:hypothetical protein